MAKKDLFAGKSNVTFSSPERQSMGILDDYAVRKVECSKEAYLQKVEFDNLSGGGITANKTISGTNLYLSGKMGVGANITTNANYIRGATTKGAFNSTNAGTLQLADTTSSTTGVGGAILFQGYKTAQTSMGNFAAINAGKDNAIAGDEGGYLSFYTSNSAGSLSEKMKILSGGNIIVNVGKVGIGTTNPVSNLDVSGASVTTITSQASGGSDYVQGTFHAKSTDTTRGAGLFMTNVGDTRSWYAGIPYNGSAKYVISYVNGAYSTATAQATNALFLINATTQTTSISGSLAVSNSISGATLTAGNGFTGTGAYTNFTISGGIILSAS